MLATTSQTSEAAEGLLLLNSPQSEAQAVPSGATPPPLSLGPWVTTTTVLNEKPFVQNENCHPLDHLSIRARLRHRE